MVHSAEIRSVSMKNPRVSILDLHPTSTSPVELENILLPFCEIEIERLDEMDVQQRLRTLATGDLCPDLVFLLVTPASFSPCNSFLSSSDKLVMRIPMIVSVDQDTNPELAFS